MEINIQQKKDRAVNILHTATNLLELDKFDIKFKKIEKDYVMEYKSMENIIFINEDILEVNTNELQLGLLINFFQQYYFEKEMSKDTGLDQLDYVFQYSSDQAIAYAIYIMSFITDEDYYKLFEQNDEFGNIKKLLTHFNDTTDKTKVIANLQKNNINSDIINEILNKMQKNKNVN